MKAPKKTKTLLQEALQLDSEARTVFLENIDDKRIKNQVETLLADEFQLREFLQQNKISQSHVANHKHIEAGTLINRIRIIKLLGQGGMGSVYLGFDEKLERQVAVKSIRPEHLKNPATQQRFEREAQIMSKINHPSICQLYDYMETPEGDFLVLEYIKGKPLYQVPMTDQQKLLYLADLAAALAVAHEHGIVHRDLKPDNIMVTDGGQLKVLDFGIAQSLSTPKITAKESANDSKTSTNDDLTQQGSLVGTIRYMSPEQAQGLSIDTASDLYALGIIAQEIFSHQGAYQITDTEQLLIDVRQGNRLKLSGLAAPVVGLIKHLTQVKPTERPTAVQAVDQINAIIHAPKAKKRRVIISCVFAVGLTLVFLLLWQWQQSKQQDFNNQLINKYEGQINAIVKQAEQIYVLPVHPVNEEINALLKQGDELFNVILNDKHLSDTAKNRLYGIILLEGEYFEDAIPLLVEGHAENNLLAYAWTRLYIEKASEFSDQHGFEQTMKDAELRENYLQPALKYIDLAQQDSGQLDPLLNAFVMSQTNSFEAGLQAVDQLIDDESWNKEAVNLKAMILYALMANAREQGEWELAKEYALMTADTYQRSTEMARSYPPSYNSLCLTYLNLMSDAIHRSGDQVRTYMEQSIAACENALTTQPNNTYPKHLLSRIYMLKALWEIENGEIENGETGTEIGARDSLAQAKAWNLQASSLSELYISNWNKALIMIAEARLLIIQGQEVGDLLAQAVDLFEKLFSVNTEFQPYVASDFLNALSVQSQENIRRNQNITATLKTAQKIYDQAMLTENLMISEQWGLINNMAQIYWLELWQHFMSDKNILLKGDQLLAFLNPADNNVNNEPLQLITSANTHLLLAEYLRHNQQPLGDHLNQAEHYINQALIINANNQQALLSQASLLTLQAFFTEQDYTHSNQIFAQAVNINLKNPYSFQTWANSLMVQAENSPTQESRTDALNSALENINRALSIDSQNPMFIHTRNKLTKLASKMKVNLKLNTLNNK